jgi:GDP-4-dehydro-6-deoxy-D-mannose reductase
VRVWITGARGFVGSWLAPRLEREGAAVVAVDREVDVTDAAGVERALAAAAPDAVVHLAALSSVASSLEQTEATARVNFLGTRAVLEAAARRAPRARVLLVSSGEVYGPCADAAHPHHESAPLRPESPYARTKAAGDLLGGVFADRGLEVVRARPFNHTGPGQSDAFVASSFARQLAEIEAGTRPPVLCVGNLDAVRDFSDVSDVVDAYVRLLDPRVPARVYNIASGVPVPIRTLLELLMRAARVKPEVRVDPARWRPARASVGSAARLGRVTGWAPRIPLADTLGRLLDAWRAQVGAP